MYATAMQHNNSTIGSSVVRDDDANASEISDILEKLFRTCREDWEVFGYADLGTLYVAETKMVICFAYPAS